MTKTLKNLILSLMITFYFSSHAHTTPHTYELNGIIGPLTEKYLTECNQHLVRGYGLQGLKKPVRMELSMCPTVVHSCCSKRDQLTIFANWIHSMERGEVLSRLELNKRIYKRTLDLMVRTTKLARKIAHKLRERPISNCGLLAKKINLFQIDGSEKIILKAFDQMNHFMIKSYDGFYCAICDHRYHTYFDMDDPIVHYGTNFCRDTIENTLIPALYMNVNFPKMINAMTRFVTSCDFKGTFTRDIPIPPQFQFEVIPKVAKSLHECRESRNKRQWFVECEPLCREMSLYKLSPILVPHIDKLAKYNTHLEAQLKRINNESRLKVISSIGGIKKTLKKAKKKKSKKDARRARILTAAKPAPVPEKKKKKNLSESDKKRQKKREKKKKEKTRKQLYKERGLIFFTQRAHAFVQQNTKYEFMKVGGMNLFSVGKSTRITDAVFSQVKTSITLEKLGYERAASYGIKAKKSGILSKASQISDSLVLLGLLFLAARFD